MDTQELIYTCLCFLTAVAETCLVGWWFAHHKDRWVWLKLVHSSLGFAFSLVWFILAFVLHGCWPVVLWFWLLVFTGLGDIGFLTFKLCQSKDRRIEISSSTSASSNRRWFGQYRLWSRKPSSSRRFGWKKTPHLANTWNQPTMSLPTAAARLARSQASLDTNFHLIPLSDSNTHKRALAPIPPPFLSEGLPTTLTDFSQQSPLGLSRSHLIHPLDRYTVVFLGPNAQKKEQLARQVMGCGDDGVFPDNPLFREVAGKESLYDVICNAEATMDVSDWQEIKRHGDMFVVVFDESNPDYEAVRNEVNAIQGRPTMLASFEIEDDAPTDIKTRAAKIINFGRGQQWLSYRVKGPNYEIEAESMFTSLVQLKMKQDAERLMICTDGLRREADL